MRSHRPWKQTWFYPLIDDMTWTQLWRLWRLHACINIEVLLVSTWSVILNMPIQNRNQNEVLSLCQTLDAVQRKWLTVYTVRWPFSGFSLIIHSCFWRSKQMPHTHYHSLCRDTNSDTRRITRDPLLETKAPGTCNTRPGWHQRRDLETKYRPRTVSELQRACQNVWWRLWRPPFWRVESTRWVDGTKCKYALHFSASDSHKYLPWTISCATILGPWESPSTDDFIS